VVSIQFMTDGLAIVPDVVTSPILDQLRNLTEFAGSGRPGVRVHAVPNNIHPLIEDSGPLGRLASALMVRPARAVRVLFFDKRPDANWAVPWHQDRTIAVKARADVAGFAPWTIKRGVHHVEPPADILAGMLALRLHIDDCESDNGPLLAAKGSFARGAIRAADVRGVVERSEIVTLSASAGDVVAMRGMTVHASHRSTTPKNRRVLHVDFATCELPEPLEWALT
jgi:Phytanoyl-CoA dioxygenase (PhyH)